MNDPDRVRVAGPLAPYMDGFRGELEARGYAPASTAVQMQLVAQLSRWLERHRLGVSEMTPARVDEFFQLRRTTVRFMQVSPRSLRVLLEHLASVGVLPVAESAQLTGDEVLVRRYGQFLLRERALEIGTARRYQLVARRFLATCSTGGIQLSDVTTPTVTAFMASQCRGRSSGWAKCVATAMRSLLRFLYLEELIHSPIAATVPATAGWQSASLPKALTVAHLGKLLAACDRGTCAGRRDYAIVLLAARLGLRAGEIAGLDIDDVDWCDGVVRVRGKGRRVDVLPLPADVGQAMAGYVADGRPPVRGAVFRTIDAPRGPLAPATVTGIVYRACDRAGVARIGAHRLRHTAATQMLGSGASLPEIAQVLRHRSPNTTAIYAKVDRQALQELARPWPTGDAE